MTSAGLVVTATVDPPPSVASGVQHATVRATIGFASAFVSRTHLAADASGSDTTGGTTGAIGPTGGGLGSDLGSGIGAGAFASPSFSGPPAIVAGGSAPAASAGGLVTTIAGVPISVSVQRFYPALVLAAVAGLGICRLFSTLGVKDT